MRYQISNKELVYYFINEVFSLDRRKYLFICSNLKTRKKYLPSLEETCNYNNIGEEFVKRVESEFMGGHDIVQRRATYFFFRERFQKAYAQILGIPFKFSINKKVKEELLEKEFKGYLNINIASLPQTKLPFVAEYAYMNLKYMTKVIWLELEEINTEEDFINLLHNKISFTLKVSHSQLADIKNVFETLQKDFVFLVFNNCEISEGFTYYKQLREFVKSENSGNYLRLIEIYYNIKKEKR